MVSLVGLVCKECKVVGSVFVPCERCMLQRCDGL